MPLYEYRCRECGHRFEVLQRLGEGAEGLTCPRCGEGRIDKQFSTFASQSSSASQGGAQGGASGACSPGFG